MMKLTDHPHRPWRGIIQTLTLAVAAVGLLIPIEAAAQGLTTHDANMASQHQSQSGQLTTHDGNQTSQHNALSQKIDNLSTGADHRGLPQNWDKTLPANDGVRPYITGEFVLLDSAILDRSGQTRYPFLQQGPANACFELREVNTRPDSFAGIRTRGLTHWRFVEVDTAVEFPIFQSPGAGYDVTLQLSQDGLRGTGTSRGIADFPPIRHPIDAVRATRLSDTIRE